MSKDDIFRNWTIGVVDFALDGQISDGDWFVKTGALEEEGVVVGFVSWN